MSRSCSKIDQKQLFQELQTAIEEDKLYWIRNDAKIKASTTSKTYDEFRYVFYSSFALLNASFQ